MGWFLKFLAVVISIGIIAWIFGENTKYIVGAVVVGFVLLVLIRLGAILFWYGRDKGQW